MRPFGLYHASSFDIIQHLPLHPINFTLLVHHMICVCFCRETYLNLTLYQCDPICRKSRVRRLMICKRFRVCV